jgi:hypothetical protein
LKTRRNAARKYRKLGYSAAERPAAGDMPAFLHGFAPDLVATSEDDKVVLEIKRAADLKGSNEIKELAAVIDRQAGWLAVRTDCLGGQSRGYRRAQPSEAGAPDGKRSGVAGGRFGRGGRDLPGVGAGRAGSGTSACSTASKHTGSPRGH